MQCLAGRALFQATLPKLRPTWGTSFVHIINGHVQGPGQRTFYTDLEQVVAQDLRRLVEQLLCFRHSGHHILPPALALHPSPVHKERYN